MGGFYRAPQQSELLQLEEKLLWARQASLETVRWTSTLDFPKMERDYEFVALRNENEYAINEGRLVSNKGLDIPISEYEQHFHEIHVPYSNALQSALHGHSYFVGPMARYNLNYDKLPPSPAKRPRKLGSAQAATTPSRALSFAASKCSLPAMKPCEIIREYTTPDLPSIEVGTAGAAQHPTGEQQTVIRDGTEFAAESIGEVARTGFGCTEAPRGFLYHRYDLDEQGLIADAKIVPPTSQNQKAIEEDLREFVSERIDLPTEQLTWQCEQAVRNYDPCISCATHFLRFDIERTD